MNNQVEKAILIVKMGRHAVSRSLTGYGDMDKDDIEGFFAPIKLALANMEDELTQAVEDDKEVEDL